MTRPNHNSEITTFLKYMDDDIFFCVLYYLKSDWRHLLVTFVNEQVETFESVQVWLRFISMEKWCADEHRISKVNKIECSWDYWSTWSVDGATYFWKVALLQLILEIQTNDSEPEGHGIITCLYRCQWWCHLTILLQKWLAPSRLYNCK